MSNHDHEPAGEPLPNPSDVFIPISHVQHVNSGVESNRVQDRLARLRSSMTRLMDLREWHLDQGISPPAILDVIAESRTRATEDLGGALALSQRGTQTVELVIKPIGNACNLNCSYCNTRSGARIEVRMDEAKLRSVLENSLVAPLAQVRLTWHGGEPMMAGLEFYRRAFQLAAEIAESRGIVLRQGIQTNGTMVTHEWAELFAQHDVRVGVSIDGPKELHDLHRRHNSGAPSYDRIIKGLKILAEHDVKSAGLAVVPDDPHLFPAFADFVTTQQLLPLSLEILFRPNGCPDPVGYGQRFARLFKLYLDRVNPDYHRPKLFESIVDSFLRGSARLCWINGTCSRHLGVDPTGTLTPCCDRLTGWKGYSIGSLTESSLPTLTESGPGKAFRTAEHDRHPKCRTCDWNFVCNSGCTEFRIKGGGAPGALDPYCEFYLTFFAECFEHLSEAIERVYGPGIEAVKDRPLGQNTVGIQRDQLMSPTLKRKSV